MSSTITNPTKSGAITLPGAHQLTLSGIFWAGTPTDEEFAAADRMAQTIDRVHAWADGDIAAEYVRREQYTRTTATVQALLAEYAMARSKAPDVVKARYCVATFFSHEQRSAALTWSHHLVLWGAGLGIGDALAWIKRCEQGGWKVEELRAQLKRALRPPTLPEPALHGMFPSELQHAVDWASGRLDEVDAMPIEAAWAMLKEAEPLVVYVKKLEARVKTL